MKRPWTAAEERRLLRLLEEHRPYAAIGRTLHRSTGAVRARCAKLGGRERGVTLLTANGRTATRVARDLGVDQKCVVWWIQQGWLRGPILGPGGRGWLRVVESADLEAFLADEGCWHLWDPRRIADPVDRHRYLVARRGLTFLTTGEVGERLFMTHYAVNAAIRQGRIRAVRPGLGNWLVRSDWVALPEPRRSPRGPRLEDATWPRIRALWGRVPATEIARRLGCRTEIGVVRAARAMGLPPLGRGYWKRRDGRRWIERRAS